MSFFVIFLHKTGNSTSSRAIWACDQCYEFIHDYIDAVVEKLNSHSCDASQSARKDVNAIAFRKFVNGLYSPSQPPPPPPPPPLPSTSSTPSPSTLSPLTYEHVESTSRKLPLNKASPLSADSVSAHNAMNDELLAVLT